MDENVMRVLQMLQEGKISATEAETLIAALRGESGASAAGTTKPEEKKAEGEENRAKFKPPKVDFDDLGKKISEAVSKVQPEKIVKRVQAQLRTATRAGAHWSATVNAKIRTWTEGADIRPTNASNQPETTEHRDQEFHLESGAF